MFSVLKNKYISRLFFHLVKLSCINNYFMQAHLSIKYGFMVLFLIRFVMIK